MKLTPRQHTLIAAVRAHATANYNSGGWDVVVECYDDEAIVKVIGRARTVKGALAKFAPIIDVVADRQAEADYQIRAAVGEPEAVEHYRTGSEYGYDRPGCGCGARFATDKAADLHVVKAMQAAGTYDPRAQGYHPDGSYVSWKHDGESGESWAVRSWENKPGCRATIVPQETETGYEVVETYRPAWKGLTVLSTGYCNHLGKVPGSFWDCGGDHCNFAAHPECEPPF